MPLFRALLVIWPLLVSCSTDMSPQTATYRIGDRGPSLSRYGAEHFRAATPASLPASAARRPDSPIRVLQAPMPAFPLELQLANVQGTVIVEFMVDEDGAVNAPKVIGTSPPELADIALAAILCWRFEPLRFDGRPGKLKLRQSFVFEIR